MLLGLATFITVGLGLTCLVFYPLGYWPLLAFCKWTRRLEGIRGMPGAATGGIAWVVCLSALTLADPPMDPGRNAWALIFGMAGCACWICSLVLLVRAIVISSYRRSTPPPFVPLVEPESRKAAPPLSEPARAGGVAPPSGDAPDPWRPAAAPEGAEPPSANVGALIGGKYELQRRIGQGGMGTVFLAQDRVLDRKVAIKQMRAELRDNPEARERFLKEASIIAHLTHPNIVPIHDIVREPGGTYLVLDYVQGRALSEELSKNGRLPLSECKRIFRGVCEAVDYAHRARVLHRDLKPSNIMLNDKGLARVMDFGLAREAKDSISRLTHKDCSGTPAYMAPEQHLGTAHRSSDIFALGVTLYEMLTGKLPYGGPDFLTQKERRKFSPPNFLVTDLPKNVELLMTSVLEPDHKKRIRDAMELFQLLEELEGS